MKDIACLEQWFDVSISLQRSQLPNRFLIRLQHPQPSLTCVVSGSLVRLVDSPPMLVLDGEQGQQGVQTGGYPEALEGDQRVACLTKMGADELTFRSTRIFVQMFYHTILPPR